MYQNLKNKKINIYTLGCKVNQYESDAMLEELLNHGCIKADENEAADIYIINTCSVTNMADRKSRQIIHRMRKQGNPHSVIAATGCYIQASGQELLKDGSLDVIIGNNRKKDVARILSQYLSEGNTSDNIIDINKATEYENTKINKPQTHTRAYVKVQDGCNNFCTYCIIPYVRGRIRSKKLMDIVDEVATLAENGVKEIILTGINISNYQDKDISLTDLIYRISKIQGIDRIRMSSIEPRAITKEFLERVSKIQSFCPHFHLSLQSACNKTLKAMNRKYTIEEYTETVELLRKYFDRPAITTDIIVGFPGETDEDFKTTYENLEKLNLYEMHVFKYSKRKGTIAEKMPDQVDEQIKTERSNRLLELTEKQKKAFEMSFSGQIDKILVEEIVQLDGKKYYRGHTKRYILIDKPIEDNADVNKTNNINKEIDVQL
ncbi:MAG: tRNA (N(6)-L-threonylcarbamoyladenosine(37)-C(2))-methylthiotransferase MtaB [Eubacterium sp.]|nr:tRNA (N(6)-L-threonylcarbamoyladenosine(37)-C(2))-methylthiotransferase MtaB [Eubacterium sp.]